MPQYETTFILSPDLEETELEKNIGRYTGIITSRGGTLVKQERWGIRRMAYQIKKKSQGFYMHLVHESGTDVPRELERQFQLNESCLRYLTVRVEQKAAEPPPKSAGGHEMATASASPEVSAVGGSSVRSARDPMVGREGETAGW